ncbi:hypothetical protein P43SY_004300 [Pythium insidiosum]|uniref:Amino acid transporter n=1 Tax=Pythium insidiosum TaxID=114742 RepID=A0AAD5M6Q2_PYTIN|nr:hypothetical protein P43SY_004300 [Pythium insidiosum]
MTRSPKPSTSAYEVVQSPTPDGLNKRPHHQEKPAGLAAKLRAWYFGVPGIIAGAVVGLLLGYGLQRADPSAELVSWIAIPGELFIRAIKCLVSPLVFCSLIVGMSDMLAAGKASQIGWRTALLYGFTTLVATCQGLVWVLIFRPWFGNDAKEDTAAKAAEFALQCGAPGYFLSHANGTVQCVFDAAFNATQTFSPSSVFAVTDIHKSFATAASDFVRRTLSQALQGQLFAIVTSNITQAFADGVLLSIIAFAIPFGIAISLLPRDQQLVAGFFREVNQVFMTMISWIILCTPVAIVSLLAGSIATQDDLSVLVSDVGLYVLCVVLAELVHALVFYPVLLRVFVKGNPFMWLRQMARAQVFAFGSASSMATLPVVIECMDATRVVSQSLSRFVLSLGATIGMDGGAIGYPIAIIFMAEAEGIGHIVGTVEYVLIVLVATIGAVGAGPVPASGIVMTMTIWGSVFPGTPLPSTFAFIVAVDWFLDRFYTVVNVTCDTVVCRIIAELVGETLDESERQSLVSVTDELAAKREPLRSALADSEQRLSRA